MAESLLANLQDSPYHIGWLAGRSSQRVASLSAQYQCQAWDHRKGQVVLDVIFLAVSDSSIEEVCQEIHEPVGLLVHHSGASALELLDHKHCDKAVLWPIDSLQSGGHDLSVTPLAVDGSSPTALNLISEIASTISVDVFEAGRPERQKLHLGAVILNNFFNHLLAKTDRLIHESSRDIRVYRKILETTLTPLMQWRDQHPVSGHVDHHSRQTGPAVRRDFSTMETHLDMIEDPYLKDIYRALSQSIIQLHHEDPS